ncbi:MAG: hypothetical protein ACRES7_11945 [Gammaproteobacteria bacterium]
MKLYLIGVAALLTAAPPLAIASQSTTDTMAPTSAHANLVIPKPPRLDPAPAQLAEAFQQMAVLPGEQQLALFIKSTKEDSTHPAINMLQIVTSMNGKAPPVDLEYFKERVTGMKKVLGLSSGHSSSDCKEFIDSSQFFGTECNGTGTAGPEPSISSANVLALVNGYIISVNASNTPALNAAGVDALAQQALLEAKAIEKANR